MLLGEWKIEIKLNAIMAKKLRPQIYQLNVKCGTVPDHRNTSDGYFL